MGSLLAGLITECVHGLRFGHALELERADRTARQTERVGEILGQQQRHADLLGQRLDARGAVDRRADHIEAEPVDAAEPADRADMQADAAR